MVRLAGSSDCSLLFLLITRKLAILGDNVKRHFLSEMKFWTKNVSWHPRKPRHSPINLDRTKMLNRFYTFGIIKYLNGLNVRVPRQFFKPWIQIYPRILIFHQYPWQNVKKNMHFRYPNYEWSWTWNRLVMCNSYKLTRKLRFVQLGFYPAFLSEQILSDQVFLINNDY